MTLLAVNSVGKINTLMDIITDEYRDKPVDLHQAFKATSMDVITAYCYAQSFDALHSPGFAHPMLLGMEAITATMTAVRQFSRPHIYALPARRRHEDEEPGCSRLLQLAEGTREADR